MLGQLNTLSPTRGRIIEWHDQKGFGFVDDGRQRVFLHRRDFRQRHTVPMKGDLVTYTVGLDERGRPCARDAEQVNDGGRWAANHAVVLGCLLFLPGFAFFRLIRGIDVLWPLGWMATMSVLTYVVYAFDKKQAREQTWRTAESTLHLCELVGGWPGAFVAQRRLRHKAAKISYQFTFWFVVFLYQYLALDWLLGWKIALRIKTLVGG